MNNVNPKKDVTTGIVTTGVHLKWRMSSQTFEKFEMVLL
jgi:UDP-N-acetylglucosamine 2-epimerase